MAAINSNAAYKNAYAVPEKKVPQAPRSPEGQPIQKSRTVKPAFQTREQQSREFAERVKRIIKIFIASVMVFAMCGTVLYERAQLLELTKTENHYREMLEKSQSKKVSLEAQFNSLISLENVEEYAKNELGMVKRQRYQTKYFERTGEDKVELANGIDISNN